MLAMGWNIERSKEGEAMFQQREGDKQKKTSDPQVKSSKCIVLLILLIHHVKKISALDIKMYVF